MDYRIPELAVPSRHAPSPATLDGASIGAAIAGWARTSAERPALVGLEGTVTYAQLSAFISDTAASLARSGLTAGCRVGLVAGGSAADAQIALAICCTGTLVSIGPALTPPEVLDLVEAFALHGIVLAADAPESLKSALQATGIAVLVYRPGEPALELLTRPARIDVALRGRADVALLLRSSGTTGRPKIVQVTHGNLVSMARKVASPGWFGIGPDDRTAAMLPMHYASGLKNMLLVPMILGASVAFPGGGEVALAVHRWLDRLRPTYLCTAPASLYSIVERLAADGASLSGSGLRFVMCSSSYLPDALRLAAERACGAPVLEFYGLSEAGIMAANPIGPGLSRPGTVGRHDPDELAIVDEHGTALPPGRVGQIVVRGPSVSPGYFQPDRPMPDLPPAPVLATGDLGSINHEGYLTISGRTTEVINRGGEKVFPYEVEKALLAHPDVLEAAVFGVPHPRLGESVAAAVVARPGRMISAEDLASFLAVRLARYKLPRRIRTLEDLPRGPTGKVQRAELVKGHAADDAGRAVPDSLIELEILTIWQRLLGRTGLGVDDDFHDNGGDSLLAADMLLEVEQVAGMSLDGFDPPVLTVRAVADAVVTGLPVSPALVRPVRSGRDVPLFFCHGDHLARGIYAHRMAGLLPEHRPVFLLDCPANDATASVEAIAAGYLPDVLSAARGSPVFVGGYCGAGLVAWHLAHLLRASGVEVAGILLIDTPSHNAKGGLRVLASSLRRIARLLPPPVKTFVGAQAMRGFWALRRRGMLGFAAALRKRVAGWMQRPDPGGDPVRRLAEQLPKLYYERMARYVPPRIDVPVTCLVAQEGNAADTDPARWSNCAPWIEMVQTPGTHQSAVVTHRAAFAAAMERTMSQTGPSQAPARETGPWLHAPS